jgi:tRNA pseudouridine55 synthase
MHIENDLKNKCVLGQEVIFAAMKHLPSIKELQEGGVILIDKPYRWTSFDAVNKIKRLTKAKIGHCGTLDPLATGLLICCTGKFTKKISDYQRLPKEYTGIFHLGAVTPTYDLESEPQDFRSLDGITDELILQAAKKFTGDIMQVPPIHSAVKKDGKRAYELARKGKEVVLDARPVTIGEFEITAIELPEVHFRVACSTGTYIRSLANDFGEELGCGAYLQELRRTRIGNFSAEGALTPDQWRNHWLPPAATAPAGE